MKTIEMKVGNKVVKFTPKSLIIGDTEYLYGKITDIKHSASKHVYAFKYNGEVRYLPYDPKYEAGLKVIFSKINALHKKQAAAVTPAAAAPVAPAAPVTPAVPAEAGAPIVPEIPVAPAAPEAPAAVEAPAAPVSEAPAAVEVAPAEEVPAAPVAEVPTPEELAAMADETVFDIPEELKNAPAAAPVPPAEVPVTPEGVATVPQEGMPVDPAAVTADGVIEAQDGTVYPDSGLFEIKDEPKPEEKKGKLKKSLLVFLGIIVLIGLLSVAYFHFFGTSSNPTTGPNSNESQQYDNIDELIENLDE